MFLNVIKIQLGFFDEIFECFCSLLTLIEFFIPFKNIRIFECAHSNIPPMSNGLKCHLLHVVGDQI